MFTFLLPNSLFPEYLTSIISRDKTRKNQRTNKNIKSFRNYIKLSLQLIKNCQNLVHKFDKKMKVNFQYMAKEDSLNIYLYDDLMNEVGKPKKQYHKIQMKIHLHCLIDELFKYL
jgi:hypothetical protein